MKRIFDLARNAFVAARTGQERRAAFARLDAHTLRDIGFEEEADRARRRAMRERLPFGVGY